jgi:hypothetical protein
MKRAFRIAAAALAFSWYGWFLFTNVVDVAGGSDSSGYANAARMMGQGRLVERVSMLRELNLPDEWAVAFSPLGFWSGPEPGTIIPTYPLGFPAQMAILAEVIGEHAGFFLLVPLMALGSVVAMYFLARELGIEPEWSVAAAAMLAAFPTFVFLAIQPMSDVPALFWCLLAMLAALKSRRTSWLAAVSGALFGVAVAVRPTNVLLLVPLAMAIGWRPKQLVFLAAGASPFAGALMYEQWALFGSPFATGYGPISDLMKLKYFEARFFHYASWLLVLATPLVFPLGLFSKRRFLAAWFGVFFIFYCFYEHYDAWWYTRFLLPGVPALIAGALLSLSEVRPRLRLLLIAGVVLTGVHWSDKQGASILDRDEQHYRNAVNALEPLIPERAVVVAMQMSGALRFYGERTALRYDLLNADRFQILRAHASIAGYPAYAVIFDHELKDAMEKTGARWTPVAMHRAVTLYKLEDER